MLELAEMVGKVMGQKPVLEFAPARAGRAVPQLARHRQGPAGPGLEAAEHGFDDGLPELVDWFRKEAR